MNEKKDNKKKSRLADSETDRRDFIKKSARDIGACGYALYELAKTIREEIVQGTIDDIKEVIRKS